MFPETVILTGPRYVKSGDSFWINCSSDIIPYREIAEFSVNGVTVNALRRYKTRCISLTTKTECFHDICNCDEGKKFSLRLNGYAVQEQLEVECSMKYVAEKPFFETSNLSIQVIGKYKTNLILQMLYVLYSKKKLKLKMTAYVSLFEYIMKLL